MVGNRGRDGVDKNMKRGLRTKRSRGRGGYGRGEEESMIPFTKGVRCKGRECEWKDT